MALKDDLLKHVNEIHTETWKKYDDVKQFAGQFGLKTSIASSWKSPGEPAFVSQLVSDRFVNQLRNRVLSGLCLPYVSGAPLIDTAFLHQKPKVEYGPIGSRIEVELADLLLVRHHFVFGKNLPQGRAFLLQAKTSNTPRTGKLTLDDIKQFDLYNSWQSKFTFPNEELKKVNGSKEWDFSGGGNQTGVYGVVYNGRLPFPTTNRRKSSNFPDGCAWGVSDYSAFSQSPKSAEASGISLSAVLDQFLNGTYGREWSSDPFTKEDWSLFIQNLLAKAASWVFPIQRLDIVDEPRLKNMMAYASQVPFINFAISSVVARNLALDDWRYRHDNVSLYYYLRDFNLRNRKKHPSDLSNLENIDQWVKSLHGHIPDEPRPNIDVSHCPPSGIQTLYIATFGERPLPNSQ